MLFNSIEYLIFLPLVFVVYWWLLQGRLLLQNIFILAASLLFYGWWDWRFLFLMLFTAGVDYIIALLIEDSPAHKKKWLLFSIISNLGVLGYFKYCNFFIENFAILLQHLGFQPNVQTLQIILPVGISFYTFQSLSYTIDVYRGELKAARNPIEFFTFVSLFPQLVAGPIERATHLLPQVQRPRYFDYEKAKDGLKQILWGLCKKIIIADNCANYVNQIFDVPSATLSPTTLCIGAILFAFQIYGDFSGYSDIAIGSGKLLGFSFMQNFKTPYFSRDIAEFWRRWHISLSTWFRDYLYIPLGGSKEGIVKSIRNTIIIFLVSGFWHGANWTFIAWGGMHALYFIPLLVTNNNRRFMGNIEGDKLLPSVKALCRMIYTFSLVCISWVFFRAVSIQSVYEYFYAIAAGNWKEIQIKYFKFFPIILIFIIIEWIQRNKEHPLQVESPSKFIRWSIYYLCFFSLWYFIASAQKTSFIYFAF